MEAVPSEAVSPHIGKLRWGMEDRGTALSGSNRRARMRLRERNFFYPLLLADLMAVVVAAVASVEYMDSDELKPAALLVIPAALIGIKAMGLYGRDQLILRKTTLDETSRLFQIAAFLGFSFWLLEDLLVTGKLESGQVMVFSVIVFGLSLLGRAVARLAARRLVDPERCLVIGDVSLAQSLRNKLAATTCERARVVGVVSLDEVDVRKQLLENTDDVKKLVHELGADRVIVASRQVEADELIELVRILRSLDVRLSVMPQIPELVGRCVQPDDLQGIPMLAVRGLELSRSSRLAKRALDVVGSALGLLFTAPFIAAAALAIRLDSPGPAFFWQTRVGKDGRPFRIVKFRTMVDGADAKKQELLDRNESDGLFKIAEDPRITRVGRLLRHASLDELPQLWNVFRGQMSLVGPRPLVQEDDQRVQGWYRRRLGLTPGMTGHWQILGASKIPLVEMVEIDYLYVVNWSLWTDLKILARTAAVVANRNGL